MEQDQVSPAEPLEVVHPQLPLSLLTEAPVGSTDVYLREIIAGSVWDPSKFELPIAIGRDAGGNDLVADLTTMPHLLIAGETGSGTRVCMNTLLAGLLMSRTPDQMRLMLIDPKIVEFSVYNDLPHLLGTRKQTITDPKRVVDGLRWAITEMERRYRIMAKAGVRNIRSFNQRPLEKQQGVLGAVGDTSDCIPERLPYVVIVISELADLMLTAGAYIDGYMARLTQLSRAVGIHMIIATHRPSVDVITASIRATFAARIAFQVAQESDSRIILDANGAERLAERGDMLFLPPGSSQLIRAQSALTTDEDIHNIVDFIKQQAPLSAADEILAANPVGPPVPLAALPPQGVYELPPTSLLEEIPPVRERVVRNDTDATARIIIQTLSEFGIETELKSVESGPVVTRYELVPAPGVRVARIANLPNNLALALNAPNVRVQAPIPGKGTVGIEVPNVRTSAVYLREILAGPMWSPAKFELPLVIGRDSNGNDLVADLTTMPHLLIAGGTASDTRVCMNTLLAGLLMSRTPDQMQLMLIDPKIVEFSLCNNLPHLLGTRKDVITDPKRVVGGLRWAITEMERRYKMLASAGVGNIKSFNLRPIAEQQLSGACGDEPACRLPDRLPYIVIVIDELADLMLTSGADIDGCMARLTQLSGAVGIHMIIATQWPSVNVITGTIKATFPARIAFQVAGEADSRTILEANGADRLLGCGDMLFLPPGSGKLIRAQGVLTTAEGIGNIVDFIKRQLRRPPVVAEPATAVPDTAPNPATAPHATTAAPAGGQPSFDQMLANGGSED